MPYASIEELPPAVRSHLPGHAQEIFRAAFNSALQQYGDREPAEREDVAHRVAWAAVKHGYRKVGDFWEAKD